MLSGDLSTMSLADVLQWADGSRARGVLTIDRPSGTIWMQIADRHVITCVRAPSRGVLPERLAARASRDLCLDDETLAIEMLYDQLLDGHDRFVFKPDAEPPRNGITVEVALQEIVMTGMQYVDEWPWVRDMYPTGSARVNRLPVEEPESLTASQLAVLRLAEHRPALDDVRLYLGISYPALLRKVDLLRRLGCVTVDGAPEVVDLSEQLVRKTLMLIGAKQFDEAAHVFAALLSADPGSQRIRELLRTVESEHVAHLHKALPPRAIVRKRARLERVKRSLTHADREVASRINGRWDVATIVLACSMREVETLKSLSKLLRLEAIDLLVPIETLVPPRDGAGVRETLRP